MMRPGPVLAFLLALLLSLPARAEPQGYAVVVGIDDYPTFEDLGFAEKDAARIAEYFRSQGYSVSLLLGSEGRGSRDALFAEINRISRQIDEDDRFVFSFSGHGVSEEKDGIRLGYLITSEQDATEGRISAGEIQQMSRVLDAARHQLFIFASCYGGLLGQLPRRSATFDSAQFMIEALETRRSRHYFSAGGHDQQVLDGGPSGLSWFTYFMLKGLEPGTLHQRSGGILTFAEWASFVQAYAANPFHTPSFGSLAGDEGGQLLLRTSDQGQPPLATLTTVTEATLRDMGFLTRGDARSVAATIADMKRPIDDLYRAWEALDLTLYMSQFADDVVQTGHLKGGRAYSRGYDEILSKRRELFPRLAAVDVVNYEVMYQGIDDDIARFAVRYNMDFHFKDGRTIRERDINECYKVKRDRDGAWRIAENNDYLAKLCE